MRVDPDQYSGLLLVQYGIEGHSFNALLNHFAGFSEQQLTNESFNSFMADFHYPSDSPIYNQLYDIFNYLRLFREGSVFKLFKGRQAEWKGPQIKITESDVPSWDAGVLNTPIVVYRGMSKAEYDSGDLGQSWSVDCEVARQFATESYTDEIPGIVVRATIDIESIIYHDPQDCEREVIIRSDSKINAIVI